MKLGGLYPDHLIFKARENSVFAFFSDSPEWLKVNRFTDRAVVEQGLRKIFTTRRIYCYNLVPGDSIPVKVDSAAPIRFKNLYIEDLLIYRSNLKPK